jgi:ATP-dependent Clp protease ATP-binding subunit ClpC
LIKALQIARAEGHHDIGPGDLFVALAMIEPALDRLIDELGLKLEDLLNIVYWYNLVKEKDYTFLATSNFLFTGGVGKDWIFGYTRYLNRFGSDITELIRLNKNHLKYIGHKEVIEKLEKGLLSASNKNIVIVGSEGAGKKTAVYGLARDIVRGEAYGDLKLKRVLELDLEAVLSGANSRGEIVARLNRVFSEAERVGNLILFIDNFTNLLSTRSLGQVDASQILLPYLSSPAFNIIGTSQPGAYHRYIENNPALNQRIQKVEIEEPSKQEMIRILEDLVPELEARTNCFFHYLAIKEVLNLANRYVFDQPNPQKALKLLDKVASESRNEVITKEKVREIASTTYKIPVGEAGDREKKKLLNLEEILHRRVINQNQAIEEIAHAMRRARAEVGRKGKKPIGSFLFIGPTGVGKTETAKALSESYFSGEENMNRFDMSEYQNKQDVYRLLGDEQEGGRPGRLSEVLKQSPHSLLLFDEVEKAHPDILNLFLQILDEGVATNSQGKKLVFSNTIIIATSNAGAQYIRDKIGEGINPAEISDDILDYLMDKGIFKPEFLNRFSSVVSFSPLTRKQIEQIAKIKLDKLKNQIKSEKDIDINFGERVATEIASRGYNPEMGARPMERTIEQLIENLIAKKILANDLKRGDQLTIRVEDFEE